MQRIHEIYRPGGERKHDFNEVELVLSDDELREQTSRCMNCGQPFCHAYGCPLGNLVPDQNRAVSQGDWRRAPLSCPTLRGTSTVLETAPPELRFWSVRSQAARRYR